MSLRRHQLQKLNFMSISDSAVDVRIRIECESFDYSQGRGKRRSFRAWLNPSEHTHRPQKFPESSECPLL
jgi:hypothetical protein